MSPALCHKHLLSREVQNEPHPPEGPRGPAAGMTYPEASQHPCSQIANHSTQPAFPPSTQQAKHQGGPDAAYPKGTWGTHGMRLEAYLCLAQGGGLNKVTK